MNGDRAAGRQTHRYRCSGPFGGAKAPNISCSGTALGPAVEAAVRAVVGRLVDAMLSGDPSVQAALRRAWAGLEARQAAPAERSRQHELERLADRARERLKAAALALVDGELDRTGYELVREQAETDLQAAGAELERLRALPSAPALPPLADVVAAACSWHALMEDSDSEVLRPFLADVVEAVVPERMRIGRYRVHITRTPTGELLRRLAKTAEAA
jgi:hypothetical protein